MNSDKVQGMIYGAFLGDALGAPHEFRKSLASIQKEYTGILDKPMSHFSRFQGKTTYDLGQFTDDSEMAICLIKILSKNKLKYSSDDAIVSYLDWANSKNNKCMGKNTRALFKNIKTKKGYEKRFQQISENNTNQSNGALMRCFPLALADNEEYIKTDCNLTNPNKTCVITNQIYIHAIKMALNFYDKELIYNQAKFEAQRYTELPELIRALETLDTPRDIAEKTTKGWCLHALWCSFWGLMKFDSYKEAIDAIILAGGDTDTNACIAGALLGAYYGYAQMMCDEKTRKSIKILVECSTENGDAPRPSPFRGTCIEEVIVELENCLKNKQLTATE